jgi:retron-type reverse transcriptase
MTLKKDSIDWAIDFVKSHSDSDLFPKTLEIDVIADRRDEFVQLIEGKDLATFVPGACRRFIVPKDELSYRQATQLDPQDSIILSAVIHQFGQGIEDRRISDSTVFSYRFKPDAVAGLYANKSAWNDFWTDAYKKGQKCGAILYCDIADFYNQIYHHVVENQLAESGFPNQATKWIVKLLESTTAGVSRGVPVGPHGIHLIAEATMIPIDNSLSTHGLNFIRFADDILVFCDSDNSAKTALASIASTLDQQQRLMLQRHKTKIYAPVDFAKLCISMIEDRPISENEDKILKVIKKYSGGDPYRTVSYENISEEDWKSVTEDMIASIIREYIGQADIDYIRLRWFYRRLTQIGHPGAIEVSLDEMQKLGPCFANICQYFASVQSIPPDRWKYLGERLLTLLDTEEVRHNEYFRLSILSLFTRNIHINHFGQLIKRYPTSEPFARREILLAAKLNTAIDWLREHKENYQNMDPWAQMAFIFGLSRFPRDEKKYFINRWTFERPFSKVLAKWSKDA